MFDPTAYENLKVVLDGAIYDLDLEGHILVVDRNDMVNLSKLSRYYDITFQLNHYHSASKAKITLATEDLYKEVNLDKEDDVGCHIHVAFQLDRLNPTSFHDLRMKMSEIWGSRREVDIEQKHRFLSNQEEMTVLIRFGRLIKEDQVDDVVEIVTHCIKTLKVL